MFEEIRSKEAVPSEVHALDENFISNPESYVKLPDDLVQKKDENYVGIDPYENKKEELTDEEATAFLLQLNRS